MFRWMDLFVDHSTIDQGCVNMEKSSKIPITHLHTIIHNFLLEIFDQEQGSPPPTPTMDTDEEMDNENVSSRPIQS